MFLYHVINLKVEHCIEIDAMGPVPMCSVLIYNPQRRYEVSKSCTLTGYARYICFFRPRPGDSCLTCWFTLATFILRRILLVMHTTCTKSPNSLSRCKRYSSAFDARRASGNCARSPPHRHHLPVRRADRRSRLLRLRPPQLPRRCIWRRLRSPGGAPADHDHELQADEDCSRVDGQVSDNTRRGDPSNVLEFQQCRVTLHPGHVCLPVASLRPPPPILHTGRSTS